MDQQAVHAGKEGRLLQIVRALPECYETWGLVLWVGFTAKEAWTPPHDGVGLWVGFTIGWAVIVGLAVVRKINWGK